MRYINKQTAKAVSLMLALAVAAPLTPSYTNAPAVVYAADAATWTITIYPDGIGTTKAISTSVLATASLSDIAVSTEGHENQVFLGWVDASGKKLTTFGNGSVLYASWGNAAQYTAITYAEKSSTGNLTPAMNADNKEIESEVVSNGSAATLPIAYKYGYKFIGWKQEADADAGLSEVLLNTITADGVSVQASVLQANRTLTLIAQFEESAYNLTYDLDGGEMEEGVTLKDALKPSDPVYTLPKPSKAGYTFTGWVDEKGNVYRTITPSTLNTDLALKATYKAGIYNVSYELNGGALDEDVTNPVFYQTGDEITLNEPKKDGYAFTGWYLDKDLKEKAPEDITTLHKDIVLYAGFEVCDGTIEYELNGGTNPDGAVTTFQHGVTPTLPTPTKPGYDFGGWYTDEYLTHNVSDYDFEKGYNHKLYAKWTDASFQIIYETNGGKVLGAPARFTHGTAVSLPKPSREGYSFKGWFTDKECTKSIEEKTWTEGVADTTVYAKWVVNAYKITLVKNKGKGLSTSKSYVYGQPVKLPTLIRKGYEFGGWCVDKNTKILVSDSEYSKAGDKVFYAKWTKIKPKKPSAKLSGGKAKATVKLKHKNDIDGYEIQYGGSKDLSVSKTKSVSKNTGSFVIRKLSKGSKYYARVRAYKKDSEGNKIYSKWSAVKSCTVK